MQFLVVKYAGNNCGVIIDGVTGEWVTNHLLQLGAGPHDVTLNKPPGTFSPPRQQINLYATSPHNPLVVAFT